MPTSEVKISQKKDVYSSASTPSILSQERSQHSKQCDNTTANAYAVVDTAHMDVKADLNKVTTFRCGQFNSYELGGTSVPSQNTNPVPTLNQVPTLVRDYPPLPSANYEAEQKLSFEPVITRVTNASMPIIVEQMDTLQNTRALAANNFLQEDLSCHITRSLTNDKTSLATQDSLAHHNESYSTVKQEIKCQNSNSVQQSAHLTNNSCIKMEYADERNQRDYSSLCLKEPQFVSNQTTVQASYETVVSDSYKSTGMNSVTYPATTQAIGEVIDHTKTNLLGGPSNYTDLQQYLGPNQQDGIVTGSSTLSEIVLSNSGNNFGTSGTLVNAQPNAIQYNNNAQVATTSTSAVSYNATNDQITDVNAANSFLECFSSSAPTSVQVQTTDGTCSNYVPENAYLNASSFPTNQASSRNFNSQIALIPEGSSQLKSQSQHCLNTKEKIIQSSFPSTLETSNYPIQQHLQTRLSQGMQNSVNILSQLTTLHPGKLQAMCEPIQLSSSDVANTLQPKLQYIQQPHQSVLATTLPSQTTLLSNSNNNSLGQLGNTDINQQQRDSSAITTNVQTTLTNQSNVVNTYQNIQQPEVLQHRTSQQHRSLHEVQQGGLGNHRMTMEVTHDVQSTDRPGDQCFDALKSSVLVGQSDPLLSQVNSDLNDWSTNCYTQSNEASLQHKQVDLSNLQPLSTSYIFINPETYVNGNSAP